MDVITTHLNADFDAFASMVAAKRLYPEAVVAFPGSQEKNVRNFFMESTLYILSIERAKDIDLDSVKRLIVVDTRQKSRIGRFAELVNSGKVEIHLYDHHPDAEDDIKGHFEVIRETGSTVTILVKELRERDIKLTSEEATVLALGIYEDTGSFTYSSTTVEDLHAAGWLMEQGANVNVVSDMLSSDLTKAQIEVLYQLIEDSEVVNIGGVEVVITTATTQGYVGDVALLVHKYRDMENLDAIFALVRMEGRVHLVGRSRIEEVNAGEVAAEFGGGGHSTAASATIRDLSLFEAREKLIKLVHDKVRPKKEAGEIMSRPVITIAPDKTLDEAAEMLTRYQVSSLPVLVDGTILGIVHRHAVERARHHALESVTVKDFMDPDVVVVEVTDPIEKVTRISVEGRNRLVPVMDQGELVGVISRSDLLEHLRLPRAQDATSADEFPSGRSRSKNVRKLLEEHFPRRIYQILLAGGEVAASRGEQVYLVGGAVRDLFLRIHNLDIDLVVEGDGIFFARTLAKRFPQCRVRGHTKFRTAVLLFEDGFKIDVATARHEYYARPGALPTVEMSSIKRDLYRRDFTMNTLAVSLNPGSLGRVLDFFGGGRDVKEKIIRVLHNLAFVEDPTRILRAIRFSTRFGFTISKHTLSLMRRAVKLKVFDRVEGKRLRNELIHILEEKNPLAPLQLMADLQIYQAIHPALNFGPRTRELVEGVTSVLSWWKYQFTGEHLDPWLVYLIALGDHLADDEFRGVMERLGMPPTRTRDLVRERAEVRRTLAIVARDGLAPPSKFAGFLRKISIPTLLFMMARTTRDETRKAISEYLRTLRCVKPALSGDDLIAMGLQPGPTIGRILRALRDARLDGLVKSDDEERQLVRDLIAVEPNPNFQTARDASKNSTDEKSPQQSLDMV
ncbi:MAG: CBS domain-containing protein [Desulfomonile sp.]|nr:CBS domain-containing protein [Desulfomonile sp.]